MRFKDYQAQQGIRKLPRPGGAVDPGMLRLGRESRGMSLTALARLLALTSHELQWIEHDKLAFPLDKLDALCEALDYPATFFTDEDAVTSLRRIRYSGAHTFACNTSQRMEDALDAAIDPKAEVRMLRRLVRDLQSQLDHRYSR